MAAPSSRQAFSGQRGTSGLTLTLGDYDFAPVEGNFQLALESIDQGAVFTTPANWDIAHNGQSADGVGSRLFKRTAGAAEPQSVALTTDRGDNRTGVYIEVSGQDATTPIQGSIQFDTDNSDTIIPSQYTCEGDCLLVLIATRNGSPPTTTTATGWTLLENISSSGVNGTHLWVRSVTGGETAFPPQLATAAVRRWHSYLVIIQDAAAGSDLAEAVGETVGVAEGNVVSLGLVRQLAETLGLAEALARVRGLARIGGDSLTLQEALDQALGKAQAAGDTVGETETVGQALGKTGVSAETVATAETTARVRGQGRTVGETVAASETVAPVRGLARSVADTLGINAAVAWARGLARAAADTVAAVETVARASAIARAVDETLAVAEGLVRLLSNLTTDVLLVGRVRLRAALGAAAGIRAKLGGKAGVKAALGGKADLNDGGT